MTKSSSDKKIALITGSGGQDGYYLKKLLLKKNYNIVSIERKNTFYNGNKIDHINILDPNQIRLLLKKYNFSEIYHLAAKVFSTDKRNKDEIHQNSFYENFDINVLSFHSLITHSRNDSKIFYPTSSYIFEPIDGKLTENSKLNPNNIYAISKAMSFWLARYFRSNSNKFISTGIMFNHESKKRSDTYITKKIINQAKQIKNGKRSFFEVQNKNQLVDWGHAKDYVNAMFLILELDKPDDFIISSGNLHSITDLIRIVCKKFEINFSDSIIKSKKDSKEKYYQGDNSKLMKATGWKPKMQIEDIIDDMM